MPINVVIENSDLNQIDIDPVFLEGGDGKIVVQGCNNRVIVRRPLRCSDASIHVDGGASVYIGENCLLGSTFIYALAAGASIEIGAETGFNGSAQITAHEASTIRIGRGCLIGSEVSIMSSDVHEILDASSGERLNHAEDIIIGEHVWLSTRSTLLRGCAVGSDSIVGFGSIVRGRFPNNVLIAGSPARVVRENVTWRG